MNDVFIRYMNLPHYVKGQVLLDENGDYNVYINNNYGIEVQQQTLEHELNHIKKQDFYNALPIRDIERLA